MKANVEAVVESLIQKRDELLAARDEMDTTIHSLERTISLYRAQAQGAAAAQKQRSPQNSAPASHANESAGQLARGFWKEAFTATLGSPVKYCDEAWERVAEKYGLGDNKKAFFMSSWTRALQAGLIKHTGAGYVVRTATKTKTKASEDAPQPEGSARKDGKDGRLPLGFWDGAIAAAVKAGAATRDAIWNKIQQEHNLPAEKRKSFHFALPPAFKKHVIERGQDGTVLLGKQGTVLLNGRP